MANIKKHLDNIKGALYGKDVRSSIHDGIDAINKEVENTTGKQVDLESTFDQLVINAGNSNAEIVDARVKADGTSYSKLGDRLDSFDSQLEHITNKKTVQDIKNYEYNIGDRIESSLYNGSIWIVKHKSDIKFQKGLTLLADDELHISVNLKGGGEGVAECQIPSIINFARENHTKGLYKHYIAINNDEITNICMYGDSLIFGQYDTENGINTIGQQNNHDIKRNHEHKQLEKPINIILSESLNSVYSPYSKINVFNKGYSGDTVTDCYIHNNLNHNYNISLFEFATNDSSICTNGGNDNINILSDLNNNNIKITTDVYRKLLVREMLRGSAVIMMLPHRYYNFKHYMANKKFQIAFRELAKELNIPCIEWNDFIGDYEIHQVTYDNIHLNPFGAEVIGKRLASLLIGFGNHDRIIGERQITMSIMKDNIITNSSEFETTGLFSPSFYSKGVGDDILLKKDGPIHYSFYLEEDKKCFMPIGRVQGSNGSITYELNFGVKQPEFKLDIEENDNITEYNGGLVAVKKCPASSVELSNTGKELKWGSVYYNKKSSLPSHLCIQGKGWHTITIKNNTDDVVLISGLRFFDSEGVSIHKIDAY